MGKAYGFFEIPSVTAAVVAVDIMCKTADVQFVTWEKKLGGRLVTIIIRGDVSAVAQAIEAAEQNGIKKPVSTVVIPSPHEEILRIMLTEFEARPVYVRRDDRIKAHFITCYISLLLYRLLEKKIGNSYTTEQLIETLRSMKMTLLNTANGYVPSYTRTEITDSLHKTFGFRTDYEFIKKSTMRSIIKQTKEINLP